MADVDENTKRVVEAGKAAKAKSLEEHAARTKGRPTPTQEENDRATAGEHIVEHEHDGSDLDETSMPLEHRTMHAKPGGADYQTRTAQPGRPMPTPVKPTT